MAKNEKSTEVAKLVADATAAMAAAIKAASQDGVEKQFALVCDELIASAERCDELQSQLDEAKSQMKSAGVSAMSEELRELVTAKVASGMRMEDALHVANRQLAHDKAQAEAAAKAKAAAATTKPR